MPHRPQSVLASLLFCCLLLAGCAGAPAAPDEQLRVQMIVESQRDDTLTCDKGAANACAIPSAYQELADKAWSATPVKNYVSLLEIGDDALLARIHLIRAARKSIEIQTYIWFNDLTGQMIFDELMAAARRGVKVRIIVDQLFAYQNPEALARVATSHVNFDLKFYNPVRFEAEMSTIDFVTSVVCCSERLNKRMHNKVFLVDGRIAIVGGRNIQNSYYDRDDHYNFRDREALLVGPVTEDIAASFQQYWDAEISVHLARLKDVADEIVRRADSGAAPELPDRRTPAELDQRANRHRPLAGRPGDRIYAVSRIQFLADPPVKPKASERKSGIDPFAPVGEVVAAAKSGVTMQTPYLALTRRARKFIAGLRKENPDFRLTISTNSLAAADHFFVYAVSLKQKRKLLRKFGADIYEMKPNSPRQLELMPRLARRKSADIGAASGDEEIEDGPPSIEHERPIIGIHAKTLVIDREIAVIGSHNFDPRSANLNTEIALIIWDEAVARAVDDAILADIAPASSWAIAKRRRAPVIGFFTGIVEAVSRALPVFDIWPFYYTSSFEYGGGPEGIRPHDPEFYRYNKDVGAFPMVNAPAERIRRYLVTGFGGLARPLL